MISLYEKLNVSETASLSEITLQYNKMQRLIKEAMANNNDPERNARLVADLEDLDMAFEILSNPIARKEYDKKLKERKAQEIVNKQLKLETGANSTKGYSAFSDKMSDDEELAKTGAIIVEEKSDKKKGGIARSIIAIIVAGGIIINTALIFYLLNKSNKNNSSQDTSITSTVDSENNIDDEDNEPDKVDDSIKSYGDATDEKVVNERVKSIYDYLLKLQIKNTYTNNYYTEEEIKNILLYMNGAFIPSDEAEAYSLVDKQISLTCGLLSTPLAINMVNYMANSDVITEDMVKQDIENYPTTNIVKLFLLGDSYCYPYLEWFNEKYNAMITTTDKEEFKSIHREIAASLADICYGDGYTIDGNCYKLNDFASLGDVNDGNVLTMLVNMFSIFNVNDVQHTFKVKNKVAGESTVALEEILSNFDSVCDIENLAKLQISDEGLLVGEVNNYHQRLQINTINAALRNYMLGNLNAYEDSYNLSLQHK